MFDPYSVDSIKNVMIKLSENPQRRKELRRLASERAAELSWDACGVAVWKAAMKARDVYLTRKGN
ncbi:MAG TPA: hypothetical protein PKB02_01980 [Anaerohalosphaeraceae bacterium]|nr:hypothetical protein [Anaerohalosphaeraceae bacterium]